MSHFEADEIYWFTVRRKGHKKGVNTYILTLVSREPRQILAFEVETCVASETVQKLIDRCPAAKVYHTDGGRAYLDVAFPGAHDRNIHDKSDTHNIEGTNADLRHYIAGLRRRSRCFFRKRETLLAVLGLVIEAYNKFGAWKHRYRQKYPSCGRDYPLSHVDFI